jgi:hypothetical protein
MQKSPRLAVVFAVICHLSTACERGGSDEPDADGLADDEADSGAPGDSGAEALLATGEPCSSANQCQGDQCIQLNRAVGHVCTSACEDDGDCQEEVNYVCGVGAGGVAQCLPPCGSWGVACVDSRPVLCTELIGHCQQCGCPSGAACNPDGSCNSGGGRGVGVACQRDDQCQSQHCSASAGVCRVGVGETCTASNCDLCIKVSAKAPTFCARRCQRDDDCHGGVCAGTTKECRPRCAALSGDPYCTDGVCQARSPDGLNATETAYFCPCTLSNCTAY